MPCVGAKQRHNCYVYLYEGLGYGMVLISFIAGNYYNMVTAWILYYLFKSFSSSLPWSTCDNEWNTPLCVEDTVMGTNVLIIF